MGGKLVRLQHHAVITGNKRKGAATALTLGALWWAAFSVASGGGLPAIAAESESMVVDSVVEQPLDERAADDATNQRIAQFKLPKRGKKGEKSKAPLFKLPKALKFQYSLGGDVESVYIRNKDLDNSLSDDSHILTPTVAGSIIYRPIGWLETAIEGSFDRPIGLREEDSPIVLPDGDLKSTEKKEFNLAVTQAYVKMRLPPFEFSVGRRTLSDPRLWLYDSDLDGAHVKVSLGTFSMEASLTREELVDMNALVNLPEGRITNYITYVEYRGIEDHKLAGYYIYRRDAGDAEGRPQHFGLRAYGSPTNEFNYWTELAALRGTDELDQNFDAHAFDVGAKYRFWKAPLQPSITLNFAWGSGCGADGDNTNSEFRQTGLHGNTAKQGGVTEFSIYGEMLDPELSNLKIFTVGIGIRPAASMFVDFVYHHYRMNAVAPEIRNYALTAKMNQATTGRSKDVGSELDIIVGFRNLFGVRGIGADVKVGWFFPGDAFDNPGTSRKADKGIIVTSTIFF